MAKRLCNYCKGEVKEANGVYFHVDGLNPCRTKVSRLLGFKKVIVSQALSKKETHVV